MSERLTKRDENGNAYYDWGCLNRNHWALGRHVDRLAAYEDTGLTPERIRELQNAFNILFESERQKQQENEQLRAHVARMKEALRKARNLLQRYKDHIKSYPCECKFGLDFYGNKTPFRDGEMCERCAELAEIDKAIGGKEDV